MSLENFKSTWSVKKDTFRGGWKQANRTYKGHVTDHAKQEEVSRYNTWQKNVHAYEEYPYRGKTPLLSPRKKKAPKYRPGTSETRAHKTTFRKIFDGYTFNSPSPDLRRKLYNASSHGSLMPLRPSTPLIVSYKNESKSNLVSHYHIRETNPGYARNALGGWYFH